MSTADIELESLRRSWLI